MATALPLNVPSRIRATRNQGYDVLLDTAKRSTYGCTESKNLECLQQALGLKFGQFPAQICSPRQEVVSEEAVARSLVEAQSVKYLQHLFLAKNGRSWCSISNPSSLFWHAKIKVESIGNPFLRVCYVGNGEDLQEKINVARAR